jgi:hypothetical protein
VHNNIDQCVLHKIICKKKTDVLDNRQSFVDGSRKHSRRPKRRALLKIRRDKIHKGLCVCVCVRVRVRARARIRYTYTNHFVDTTLWLHAKKTWFTVNSLDLLTIFRTCPLGVFPLTVTILTADFRDFPQCVDANSGVYIDEFTTACCHSPSVNHHSPTIRLYTA